MNEIPADEGIPESANADSPSLQRSSESIAAGVTEINLGDFTRTQGLMKSLRLTLNNQIIIQVEEIASGVSEAGRKFKMGDIEQANIDITRLYSAFGQKTGQWESQARSLEHQMKMQAAKNPKSISIDALNRMKAEQTAVRTRIRTAEVQFRRLHQGLDQAFTNLQNRPNNTSLAATDALQSDDAYLSAFKSALPGERPAIVQEHFEIEAELKAQVSRGEKSAYQIKFNPLPPLARLYYITQTTQLIRLEHFGDIVRIHDLESDQNSEMKLVDFVKLIQTGVWLLRPRD